MTRTVPLGPVTSRTVPQAAEPPKSAGDIATYVPVAAAPSAESRFESVGRVLFQCQRASIQKVSFITEPPPKG